jgi:hypothetical protein
MIMTRSSLIDTPISIDIDDNQYTGLWVHMPRFAGKALIPASRSEGTPVKEH